MAPKGNKGKKTPSNNDPAYAEKRKRNNDAVKRSRDKAKQKADETMQKVQELREGNKKLEGKIEEQKKTKKMLKNLFLQQTAIRMDKPTKEQLDMLNDSDEDDDVPSDNSNSSASQSDSSDSSEPAPPRRKRKARV